jgi:type I restriction enzyme S subunit
LLPPLSEQKRIAGILDKADAIRRKRQQAIGLTEQFLRSTFLDMFGDPVTNPKNWPVEVAEKVAVDDRSGVFESIGEA